MKHFELRNYGFNKILKKYCYFPAYLPLPCHCEHGWTVLPNALKSDLAVDKPLMLVFSKRRKKAWEEESNIPALIVGAPFVHYKNLLDIKQKKNAKGTVVFPSHSTFDLKADYDIKKYCEELKSLPKRFQPITICLFWLDYISHSKVYRQAGFKVVSAGPKITNSLSFAKNFYQILSRNRFATANEIGTSALYAVDFGLPFFLTGQTPTLLNEGRRDINVSDKSTLLDYEVGRFATKLFNTGPITSITSEQKKYVADELGVKDCVPREELKKLLRKFFKDQRCDFKDLLKYWVSSLIFSLFYNGPWISLVFRIRAYCQPLFLKYYSNKK